MGGEQEKGSNGIGEGAMGEIVNQHFSGGNPR